MPEPSRPASVASVARAKYRALVGLDFGSTRVERGGECEPPAKSIDGLLAQGFITADLTSPLDDLPDPTPQTLPHSVLAAAAAGDQVAKEEANAHLRERFEAEAAVPSQPEE